MTTAKPSNTSQAPKKKPRRPISYWKAGAFALLAPAATGYAARGAATGSYRLAMAGPRAVHRWYTQPSQQPKQPSQPSQPSQQKQWRSPNQPYAYEGLEAFDRQRTKRRLNARPNAGKPNNFWWPPLNAGTAKKNKNTAQNTAKNGGAKKGSSGSSGSRSLKSSYLWHWAGGAPLLVAGADHVIKATRAASKAKRTYVDPAVTRMRRGYHTVVLPRMKRGYNAYKRWRTPATTAPKRKQR